jgi:predicted RecA/RadA family phage recombinase
MAANEVERGESIRWTNPGSAVASGDVVIVLGLAGIALTDIAGGATGAVAITEVYDVTKEAGGAVVFAQGASVYWDATAVEATADSADGVNAMIGICHIAAVDADDVVAVKLNTKAISPAPQVLVLEGEVTWSGSGATLAEAVAGVLATDNIVAVIKTVPTQAAFLAAVRASDADEITFTLSAANTSDDAVIYYQVWR